MFVSPERLPAFAAHFSFSIITTSVGQDLYEKNIGIDCTMR
jgi:hypothetical protein